MIQSCEMLTEILLAHGIAESVAAVLRLTWAGVAEKTASLQARPRTVVFEAGKPVGLWVPEVLMAAGATLAPWTPQTPVTDEALVAFAPEVILLVGEENASLLLLPNWFELPACREHEVYQLDPAYLTEPCEKLGEAARVIATILHPELFTEMLPPFSVQMAPTEFFTRDLVDEG